MTHEELNRVLQECPESPFFVEDDWDTSETEARKAVLAMIEKARFGNFRPLREVSFCHEESIYSSQDEERPDPGSDNLLSPPQNSLAKRQSVEPAAAQDRNFEAKQAPDNKLFGEEKKQR